MKTLIIMRHAKSDWSAGVGDKDRPLNPRGRLSAPIMAEWLEKQSLWPQTVLCSSAVRTRETWDLFCAAKTNSLQSNVEYLDQLYLASSDRIWQLICDRWQSEPEIEQLMVLGHNPGMEDLLSRLAETRMEMPTAAIAVFHLDSPPSVDFEGQIKLVHHQKPKEL